jgi:hypothetical protein
MKTKAILNFFTSLLIAIFVGSVLAIALVVSPGWTISGCITLSAVISFFPMQAGILSVGVLRELWTGELIDKFRHQNAFLARIPSANQYVNNNAVHLADIGADPNVLINNTTYPIAIVQRTDADVSIALDKYDTENTVITDDELYALPYDKPGSVMRQHREVLEERTGEKSLHSLAPLTATIGPIVRTSGATNGNTVARKRMLLMDVINAKKAMDDLKVPQKNRILVLTNQHVNDLLAVDDKFAAQYKNIVEGSITRLFGFDVYEFPVSPIYKVVNAVLTKAAFGAAADPTNDFEASVFFYADRAVQCRGDVNMYYQIAGIDPQNRQSVVGFRLYHICLPKKATGFGAIVSIAP